MSVTMAVYNLSHTISEQIKDFIKQPSDTKARALLIGAYMAESLGVSALGAAHLAVSSTPHMEHFLAMETEIKLIRADLA